MTFWLAMAFSTAVDALAGGAALVVRRRRLTAGRLAAAAAVSGTAFALKLPLWQWGGLDLFGAIHLAYVDLAVLPPLAAVAVLWAGGTGPARGLAVLGLSSAPLAGYTTFIEPYRLQTETVGVALDPARAGRRPVRVGVLADIQTNRVTDHERNAVQSLMALQPDVILIPGDLFQGDAAAFERERAALRELLASLHAPGGVYLVEGNVDHRDQLRQAVAGTAVRYLVDEIVQVNLGDRQLTLAGLRWQDPAAPNPVLQRLEQEPGAEDVRILLVHHPDTVLALPSHPRTDLVIAGHTHGGQVQIPGWGPPITFSSLPRKVAAGGLHNIDERLIYLSRGVGWERGQAPRVRFWCPPEVSLLILN